MAVCNNCVSCSPEVYIHNNGPTTLVQNDSIIIYYQYPPITSPIIDTLILNSDLLPNDSVLYLPELNITQLGIYNLDLYVYSNSDNNNINDTVHSVIYTYHPTVNIGGINDTIIVSSYPYILNAGTGILPLTYLWSNSVTTQTNSVSSDGWYYVTISDINSCTATDSVFVYQNSNLLDLEIKINPADTIYICNNCPCNYPEFLIINNGPNPANTSNTIILNYIYSPLTTPVIDTLILTSDLAVYDTLIYHPTLNITQTGTYLIQANIFNSNDYFLSNNSTIATIYAYQVTANIGGTNDTIIVNSFPHILDTGSCTSPFGRH